jgi:predicted HTH domain antitoxin
LRDADPADVECPGAWNFPSRQTLSSVLRGAVAQLGERLNGIQEVIGSIPFSSTKNETSSATERSRFCFAGSRIGVRKEAMTSVQVSLPDSLFAALRKAPHEVPAEIRIAASIHWYQQSALSMERAAECAGLSRVEFLAELARRRVDVFVIDEEDNQE